MCGPARQTSSPVRKQPTPPPSNIDMFAYFHSSGLNEPPCLFPFQIGTNSLQSRNNVTLTPPPAPRHVLARSNCKSVKSPNKKIAWTHATWVYCTGAGASRLRELNGVIYCTTHRHDQAPQRRELTGKGGGVKSSTNSPNGDGFVNNSSMAWSRPGGLWGRRYRS